MKIASQMTSQTRGWTRWMGLNSSKMRHAFIFSGRMIWCWWVGGRLNSWMNRVGGGGADCLSIRLSSGIPLLLQWFTKEGVSPWKWTPLHQRRLLFAAFSADGPASDGLNDVLMANENYYLSEGDWNHRYKLKVFWQRRVWIPTAAAGNRTKKTRMMMIQHDRR